MNLTLFDRLKLMEMSNEIHLGTYCLMLLLQLTGIVSNGFILSLFYRISNLRKNKHLLLVLYLCISDFIFSFAEIPYSVYMTLNWNSYQLNFDPLYILISSSPLPFQLKISAVFTISIAISRNIALIKPGFYLKMDQDKYARTTTIIAIIFGIFDLILYFSLSDLIPKPDCGTSGCFVGDSFRYYWGISNMILGVIVIFLSCTIFMKISHHKTLTLRKSANEARFRQANRTSLGILVSAMAFLTIPSVFVGIFEICGLSIFKLVGPFYSTSLLSSGICNALIFIVNNTDARRIISSKSNPTQQTAPSVVSTQRN
ncbi:unnamed protein product [Caenorhabditis angaria]|uniref:G-protein coupled receptors family 1 profile domain-containing protein n=1 Tax=Caenorhabditis angaria TaxID=860376 RepID=A0A9P1N686_9PELO|nr:unnamed protein product [Caenorhabditis angaria]